MVTEADWQHWQPEDFSVYLDVVLNAFGADRIMFGSDWPVCTVAAAYQEVFEIFYQYLKNKNYQTFEIEKMLGGTALEIYSL